MSYIPEEPPDENEQFEPLDEALDAEDLPPNRGGPEGQRDLDSELVVDQKELQESGAALDDPDRIALLPGGADDPDGSGPVPRLDDPDAGWDVEADVGDRPADDPEEQAEPGEVEEIDTDPADMEQIADDAPGPDSARW